MLRGGASIIAAAFVLTSCSPSSSVSTVSYPAYTYTCCAEITAITIWQPGQHVTLHWTSQLTKTTDVTPHAISLRLTLTGPFGTVAQLKTAISSGSRPAGVRSISAPDLSVTDFTGGTPASELDLPANLPPGYYNLDTVTASGGSSAGGGAIIQIAP